ncbi:hypothetical protein SPRG_16348, partial [Saprolegnia parasitica CBS 223.65]
MDYSTIQQDEVEALEAIFDAPATTSDDGVVTLALPSVGTFAFARSPTYPIDKACPRILISRLHDKYATLARMPEVIAAMEAAGAAAVAHGQVCLFEMVDAGIAALRAQRDAAKENKPPPPALSRRSSSNNSKPPAPDKPKKKAPAATSPKAEKKSMRTATDVIHRIMWDDSITQTEVIVGYLDRFIGTVERNFAAFNWADISTLSQNETAIPQHRIQYFRWRDEIIWDKRVRLDRVFGSSGHDVIAFSPSTAAPAPLSAVAAERPANVTFHANTDRPNTFLCFRITDTAVVDTCKHAQAAIVRGDPRLAPSALAPARFHCTLLLMRLKSLHEIAVAQRVLAECQGLLHTLCASSVRIDGVSAFGNRVVYAKVAPHDGLLTLVATLKARFAAAGISLVGNHDVYQPHVTLCKLSRDLSRSVATIDARSYAAYASHDFGSQAIAGMHLCAMGNNGYVAPDGFYQQIVPPIANVALTITAPCEPYSIVTTKLAYVSSTTSPLVSSPADVAYAAIFLDKTSQQRLLSALPPVHAKVLCDHVTVAYAPSVDVLSALHLGTTVKLLVTGDVCDAETQAVRVQCPDVGAWTNGPHPHITISIAPHGAAKNSARLLASMAVNKWQTPLALSGAVGLRVGSFSLTTFAACAEVLAPVATDASSTYALKSPAVTSVHVFDFDLTLVRAPVRHHGESVLTPSEVASIGPDWYKSPMSLHPRQKLLPLPALSHMKDVLGATTSTGILLTARLEPLRDAVLRVLDTFGVTPDAAFFKPLSQHQVLHGDTVALRAAENAAYKI